MIMTTYYKRIYWRGKSTGRVRTVCGATLALAVIAVVVSRQERLVDVNGICHGFAQAMASDSHFGVGDELLMEISDNL